MTELTCLQCHNTFFRWSYRVHNTSQPFCTKLCYKDYRSDIYARFWERVSIGTVDECWPWIGNINDNGYGTLTISRFWDVPRKEGRGILAHRLAFFLCHGFIDSELLVCHSCDFRPCCNIEHLWQGTHADNTNDMIKKGRMNVGATAWQQRWPEKIIRGEKHPVSKLTTLQVEEMRLLYANGGWSYKRLGQRYNVCANTAWEAITQRTYKTLPRSVIA